MFRLSSPSMKYLGRGIATTSAVVSARLLSTSAASDAPAQSPTYDLIVIGGGSGGVGCSRRAAYHGAKVLIIEGKAFGGTCVNVGCVPKKIMFQAAHVAEVIHDSKHYGFNVDKVSFDWQTIKNSRDAYIRRLNKIYENNLDSQKVDRVYGFASFEGTPEDPKVRVGDKVYSAKHYVIAPGGEPTPLGVPGEEYVIDSNGFFALDKQPKKVAVLGAGYIAVEIAGVFNALGTDTSLFVRGKRALRNFDSMVSTHLDASMKKAGVKIHAETAIRSVTKESDGTLTLHLSNGQSHGGFDVILSAVGRRPLVAPLNLKSVGVELTPKGFVEVDEWQNTTSPSKNIYALGDVIDNLALTPVAIATGRRLADRLFGGMPEAKMDFNNVPTVVFSHPVIGTCGLTEEEAVLKYGSSNIKVYNSSFVNLWYGPFFGGGPGDKPITKYKLVTLLPNEKVIGLHAIGEASDEVIQGFSVAMKMGATKADFDNAVAIHPTASEEFVTMPPWGLSALDKTKFL